MLAAARELFAERGLAGTTTREIADRAEVDEAMLFRHYGSKERLFEEAVARPIERFLRDYSERWLGASLAEIPPEEIVRAFVESLYDLATENRELLLAATPSHLGDGAQSALGRLEDLAVKAAEAHGLRYDAHVAIRAAVAMVMTTCLFEQPLFGARGAVGRRRIVDELTELLTVGLTGRRSQDRVGNPA